MQFQIFRVQYYKMIGDPTIIFVILIQPIMFALLFGYFYSSMNNSTRELSSIFWGVGQLSMWHALLYSGGMIIRADLNKDRTIYYNLISRTSLFTVWAYRLLFCILLSIPSLLLSIGVGLLVFNIPLEISKYLIISVFLYLFSIFSLGLPLIFLLALTVWGGKILQTLTYPIFLLSGMIVPVKYFPDWIEFISYLLPITWGTRMIQDITIYKNFNPDTLYQGVLISLFYLIFSWFLFRHVMKKIKVRGDISL